MSRKRTSPHKQRVRSHGLVVTTLVLVGVFASFLVYLKTNRTVPEPPAAADDEPQQVAIRDTDSNVLQPKYDFYSELPKRELVIERDAEKSPAPRRPEPERKAQQREPEKPRSKPEPKSQPKPQSQPEPRREEPVRTATATSASRYVVQAGAYTLYSQADRARARLAMLGVQARIEEGQSQGRTVYRLRVGPMSDAEADALRRRLRANDIESLALKVN